MADGFSTVKTVVQVLNDGAKGFADLGEKIKDPTISSFFVKEAATRAEFAKELEAELALVDGDTKDIGGTAAGSIHRTWGDLKASLGGGDHALLETAEQGEDAAKKAYKEALADSETASAVREVLVRQQSHIAASHDKVKALRDAKK